MWICPLRRGRYGRSSIASTHKQTHTQMHTQRVYVYGQSYTDRAGCLQKDVHTHTHTHTGKSDTTNVGSNNQPQPRSEFHCSWLLHDELVAYVLQYQNISASCRLSPNEEMELFRLCPTLGNITPDFNNRLNILKILLEDTDRVTQQRLNIFNKNENNDENNNNNNNNIEGKTCLYSRNIQDSVKVDLSGVGKRGRIEDLDLFEDRSCLDGGSMWDTVKGYMSLFNTYKRPVPPVDKHQHATQHDEKLSPDMCVEYIHKLVDRGLKLSDWLLLYEICTGTLHFQVVQDETQHVWSALLIRLLPIRENKQQNLLLSILRLLHNNPMLIHKMPHYEEDKKGKGFMSMVAKVEGASFQRLIKDIVETINKFKLNNKITWPYIPSQSCPFTSNMTVYIPCLGSGDNRVWLSHTEEDYDCKLRTISTFSVASTEETVTVTSDELEDLSTQPLKQLQLDRFVKFVSPSLSNKNNTSIEPTDRIDNDILYPDKTDGRLSFNLRSHPACKGSVGITTLDRLDRDAQTYKEQNEKETQAELIGFTLPEVELMVSTKYTRTALQVLEGPARLVHALMQKLTDLFAQDAMVVVNGIEIAKQLGNGSISNSYTLSHGGNNNNNDNNINNDNNTPTHTHTHTHTHTEMHV
eukprot:GHVR01068218.1.p1 GENE.GHVR01068218.1~~GHVR01068218.1.p1  ORF type:complete len:637 (+),score=224.07 GHVR01068218.1:706-2616(+)